MQKKVYWTHMLTSLPFYNNYGEVQFFKELNPEYREYYICKNKKKINKNILKGIHIVLI